MQVGEKDVQNYWLEVTNPGGHSSRPVPENAIYQLSAAVTKVGNHEFPVTFTPTTRAFFGGMSTILGGQTGAAMTALLANPNDAAANAIVSKDAAFHSMLRTTCVATLLDAGHANNALPQRARANINCRIIPGETKASVQAELARVINDPKVSITPEATTRPVATEPTLDPKIVDPAKTLAAKYFPGVPMLPVMSTGATDAIFLTGIPTYGVPGVFGDMDGNGAHGLNERIRVKSVYEGRDYLYDLVKAYAGGK
jgi:acetylornithine deacetylase/succinyl-diaminopimelate desuccinylase-like protein